MTTPVALLPPKPLELMKQTSSWRLLMSRSCVSMDRCWRCTSSATRSMVLMPGRMPYLKVPRAAITWSPLAVAREWPT
ncbi:hypothetical protein D9M71_780780 [compost metagenome]